MTTGRREVLPDASGGSPADLDPADPHPRDVGIGAEGEHLGERLVCRVGVAQPAIEVEPSTGRSHTASNSLPIENSPT